MKQSAQLVFVPAPGIGHLVSTIEFSRRLLHRDTAISVVILLVKFPPPFGDDVDGYVKSFCGAIDDDDDRRIQLLTLPQLPPPPSSSSPERPKSAEHFISTLIEAHRPLVKEAILNLALPSVAGLVVDLFCTSMIDVADELRIPSYLFFTSSIAFLGFMIYLPNRVGSGFELTDDPVPIPSYADPFPSRFLPSVFLDKHGGYSTMKNHGRRFAEVKGIIVNSFAELEPHALKSLISSSSSPPVYPVGPILDLKAQGQVKFGKAGERDEILRWLDLQPEESVVFLCFGSMGAFDAAQLREIAAGLERSGCRFLWSIRKPPPAKGMSLPADYGGSYGEILPEGFEARTRGKGMICGWAPQVEVLAHRAVGGFVSHCGWNSTLESVWNGVPLVAWPLYAEQQCNAFQLARELGLAVELRLDYRLKDGGGVVTAEEIEKAVRGVTEKEGAVRKRAKEMGERSRAAVVEGGSSFAAVGRLIQVFYEELEKKP
ncbi:unnamed protein product [Linum tenue]|uniref:Glycosyltransferase n=1 Tax=Linum tenue TaxID=586396 RepID=A0AAV0GNA5_9ROSI|nr:unnamed protein product [Linum tenue]